MIDSTSLWLSSAKKTHSAGRSLAASIYRLPVTVALRGELGAGKTTFLQGFFAGLGVSDAVTSPTFALEQRYQGTAIGVGDSPCEILHIDLYRLSQNEARHLVASSEDFPGIRCIEWVDRISDLQWGENILADIREEPAPDSRRASIAFSDIPLPSENEVTQWWNEVRLPDHIRRHCKTVADTALALGRALQELGTIHRPLALQRSGELHDLFRFLDFRAGGYSVDDNSTREDRDVWAFWKMRFPGLHHEQTCARFLEERGFPEIGTIIAPHGFLSSAEDRRTIEQKLLFYADKRVIENTRVSLDERFRDFAKRYTGGVATEDHMRKLAECRAVELELFPEGAPL